MKARKDERKKGLKTMDRKLEHHLIDGKYLKEDALPQLRQNLEMIVEKYVSFSASFSAHEELSKAMEQFEDECVAYDRSRDCVELTNEQKEARNAYACTAM